MADPLLKHTEDSSESSSPSETSEMSQLLPEAVPHSAITGIRQGARPKLLTFSPSTSVSARQECPKNPSLHSSYSLPPPPPIPTPTSRFHAGILGMLMSGFVSILQGFFYFHFYI